ncbi:hypothetical protein MUCCIDRAFT_109845 [Mucor lusitanicus CBS 277.49]|uniref:Arrestin C-terminal-like domain-containing protein n=1 Tax=Mucor lusitanicus CBS 277.49 TaxID=747725 RepID=A0A168L0N8_MUCCL|nr:hypothetical protein MUCCIDRAFT_109845 [Mucor lusitanicus CBS 277.49]
MSNQSASILNLNIIPDADTIHTFSDDGSALPNESYTLSGTVEINLLRPVQIRHLYVQLKGTVECVISTSDFFQPHELRESRSTDEIPMDKWNTLEANELGFVDRLARKAMGHANASLTIAHERIVVVDEPQVLGVGKTIWPFSLKINNVHKLPPSILLPHHTIQYSLSARIKLSSLSERFKVSYWNARMNIHGSSSLSSKRKLSTSSDETTSSSIATTTSSSSAASMSTTTATDDASSISSSSIITSNSAKNKRHMLGANCLIQLCRHSYPSLYSLYSIPRIRYRGSRQDHLSYEIGMSKFTCLQKKSFQFTCRFNKLCDDAIIESMEYYLEQTESYPIRAGDWNTIVKQFPESMVPRQRKFSRAKHNMSNYIDGQELELSLSIDLPHIAPQIQTDILQISHKLRLILKFQDSTKERNMSLSFPLTVGTVPHVRSSMDRGDRRVLPEDIDAIHVRQELDQWLLTPSDQHYDEFNKLPSYRDVLREGYPPSPFIEDNY